MFHIKPDASKLALIYFAEILKQNGVEYIDCQVPSEHLGRMGGKVYKKEEFIPIIQKAAKGEIYDHPKRMERIS